MAAQLPKPIIDGKERSFTISNLLEGTADDPTIPSERRLLNLILPVWQRDAVWTESQQVSYIEGIFLGLGTGYYVKNGSDYESDGTCRHMSGWLIDGQQRITSIARFINDEITVFESIRFSQLSLGDKRRRFMNVNFPCFELKYQGDEEILKEIYYRLNFSGTHHTQADLARLEA